MKFYGQIHFQMREALDVILKKSRLGRCSDTSTVTTFHPDPSQLGKSDTSGDDRFESLTVHLTGKESSHPYQSIMKIVSLDYFTTPRLYSRTGTNVIPYPSLIMPLSSNSLAYIGLARPEGLQALLGFRTDPIQKAIIHLIGEKQYDDLVQLTCYYTEGEYSGNNASDILAKLYTLMFTAIKKLYESLAKLSEETKPPIPMVTKLIEELSSLKRPLFTFERAALQLKSEALFVVPFLNVLGVSPGSPILLNPDTFIWLGPGDYLVIEFLDPTKSQGIVDNLTLWESNEQNIRELYAMVLQSSQLTIYLPRYYAFEYHGYSGELKYKTIDMNIYDFEELHNKNKLINAISMFDSYTLTLKNQDVVVFSAHIHIVPVGNKAYNFKIKELEPQCQSSTALYALLLRGVFQLNDDRSIAPSYWRLTDLSQDDHISLTPLGLATPGAISCVFLTLDDYLST